MKLSKPHQTQAKPGRPRKPKPHHHGNSNNKSIIHTYTLSTPKPLKTPLIPKSPRTIKKERGKKLVRLARETMARKQYKDSNEGEERRLTRRLREKLETEQFQEDRMEALYNRKNSTSQSTESGEERKATKRHHR